MNKIKQLLLLTGFLGICLVISCGGDQEGGNCSISCGGFGTGQPFVQTNHPFVTEDDCRNMGMAKSADCKTSYCPPTGNSDDCFQVYP